MPTAKEDEVTVLQIESEGYNKQTVILHYPSVLYSVNYSPASAQVNVPICAIKGGQDLQKYIDIMNHGNAKIKIIHGEGHINLIGSHCVDYRDDEEEEEGETENEMETEETEIEEKAKKSSARKMATPEKGDGDAEKKVTPAKEA